MYHGWYSESQEKSINEHGRAASIYLNESGEEIKVTEVRKVESGNNPTSLQEDLKYLGLVIRWLRDAEPIIGRDRFEQARRYRLDMERSKMRETMYQYHYSRMGREK